VRFRAPLQVRHTALAVRWLGGKPEGIYRSHGWNLNTSFLRKINLLLLEESGTSVLAM
jgi:hypothetical protein